MQEEDEDEKIRDVLREKRAMAQALQQQNEEKKNKSASRAEFVDEGNYLAPIPGTGALNAVSDGDYNSDEDVYKTAKAMERSVANLNHCSQNLPCG